jgi:hypothetical protein
MDEVKRVTFGTASRNQRSSASSSRNSSARSESRYADNRNRREERPRKDNYYDDAYKESGYKGIFDIGYTLSFGNAEKGRFEISTSHGYQLNKNLFLGAGLGLHIYSARQANMKLNMGTSSYPQYANPSEEVAQPNSKTLRPTSYLHGMDSSFMFVPAFLEIRGYLPTNSSITPFASVKVGCSFNLTDGFRPAGLYFAPSIGAKLNVSPKIGLFLNLGYTFQGLGDSGTIEDVAHSSGSTTTTKEKHLGYGYYYRNEAGGPLYKTTSAQGISLRLGIEF